MESFEVARTDPAGLYPNDNLTLAGPRCVHFLKTVVSGSVSNERLHAIG